MDHLCSKKTGVVSVIIPTYNRAQYICDALDGLKIQTYKNIEVIIVDDGSTDNTRNIVSEWRKNNLGVFKDFIYFKLPRNCDEEWAWNIGFSIAVGEYIAIQSSDDVSHEERIQKEVNFLKKHSDIDMVGTGYKAFKDNINNIFYTADWLSYDSYSIERNYKKNIHCVCTGTIMFRPNILKKINGFKKIAYGVNDYVFISDIINCGCTIQNIEENLYYYRSHEEQKSVKMKDKTYLIEKLKRINGRVSIIVPINNSSNSIIDALESISFQTYNNIELIIIDNVLDDNIESVIKKWYFDYKNKNYNRVIKEFIYFKLPRKVVYSGLYNVGSYLSKGEYIAFHSESGRSNKYKIEKQVDFLKNNFLYSAVGTNYDGDDEYIKYDEEIEDSYIMDFMTCININTIMLRADVINKTAGLNPKILGKEDFEFIYRLLNKGYRVQNLKETLYYE